MGNMLHMIQSVANLVCGGRTSPTILFGRSSMEEKGFTDDCTESGLLGGNWVLLQAFWYQNDTFSRLVFIDWSNT